MKNKINTLILLFMLILGFFFPTSINSIISNKLALTQDYILVLLLVALLINNKLNIKTFLFALFINFILLFATFIQIYFNNFDFDKISWGGYLPYISLSLIFSVSFLKIKCSKLLNRIFNIIHIIILILGFGVILNYSFINNLILHYYSLGYQDLVFNMIYFKKPIGVFGSHSIASFFYFIFFYINFKNFTITKKKIVYY